MFHVQYADPLMHVEDVRRTAMKQGLPKAYSDHLSIYIPYRVRDVSFVFFLSNQCSCWWLLLTQCNSVDVYVCARYL